MQEFIKPFFKGITTNISSELFPGILTWISPVILSGIPTRISSDISIRSLTILLGITPAFLGIPLGMSLEISLEIAKGIPSGVPAEFRHMIPQIISPGILLEVSPDISLRIVP